jgi:hypothetical protein
MALKFNELQLKMSKALMQSPCTVELLAERTGINKTDLEKELQFFLQLKLISLDATTHQYALKPEIVQELNRRKSIEQEDDNAFRLSIIIEAQALEETLLKRQFDKILETMQKEPYFRIYATHMAPPEKIEEKYSSFLDINLSVRDFRALVRLMFFYGPTSVEVLKPKEVKFTLDDFQNGLIDMGEMVHGYAEYIMGILSRQQVEEFNQRLFKSLKGVPPSIQTSGKSPSAPAQAAPQDPKP